LLPFGLLLLFNMVMFGIVITKLTCKKEQVIFHVLENTRFYFLIKAISAETYIVFKFKRNFQACSVFHS